MDDLQALERRVAREVVAEIGPSERVDDHAIYASIVAATRSPIWKIQSMFSATRFVVAGAIVALFGGLLLVAQPFEQLGVPESAPGAESDGLPPVTGPAGNGLIAFERDGDIYVGDPVTGASEAIVAGPEFETIPRFSPDGTRIAFRRVHALDEARDSAIENADADWVVVRADGSDERVLAPTDALRRSGPDFVWSPDGHWLVVTQGIGPGPRMTLFLVDTIGDADPRPLGSPGAAPWGFSGDQVAWFLRPPASDRVMAPSEDPSHLIVTNLDGSDVLDLGEVSGLNQMDHGWVGHTAWSPDASRILVMAASGEDDYLYVMEEDGSDLRRLAEDGGAVAWSPDSAWSPDGSRIASMRWMAVEPDSTADPLTDTDTERCSLAEWVAIIDVETGDQRDLEATRFPDPRMADLGDCPDFGPWSWSPDGRAVLIHRGPGTRPLVVDVASDTVMELRWESDSALSWQRVSPD